jgi:hypothetical protein
MPKEKCPTSRIRVMNTGGRYGFMLLETGVHPLKDERGSGFAVSVWIVG